MTECSNCHKNNSTSAKFCRFCGSKITLTKKISTLKNEAPIFTFKGLDERVHIPKLFVGKDMLFKEDHISYGDSKMSYEEVWTVAYLATTQSINLLPVLQNFYFGVGGKDGRKILINLQSSFYIRHSQHKTAFNKLVQISNALIEPIIANRLLHEFIAHRQLSIAGIQISESGIETNGWRGKKILTPWAQYAGHTISSGAVQLFHTDGDKTKRFISLSMRLDNVVVLPRVLGALAAHLVSAE